MSLLLFCVKRKSGGEPPSPKRSRTETVAVGEEMDCCVVHNEDASIEGDVTAQAGSSSQQRKKQASKFNKEWLKGREHWLKYFPEKGMFCSLCQKHNKNPFAHGTWNTVPCSRLRQQSITAHEVCAAHKDAVKLESEKLTTIPNSLNPKKPAKGIEQAFVSHLYAIMINLFFILIH